MYSIIIFISLLFLFTFLWGCKQGAPWVPSRAKDMRRFVEFADIKNGEKMYDIGCGDGRSLCASARKGAIAQGYEISLFPFLLAKLRCFLFGNKRCKVTYQNFWRVNLGDADVVYFFLMPHIYPRLKEKFEKELKKGTRVVAYVWPIKGWKPKCVSKIKNRPNLYLYEI